MRARWWVYDVQVCRAGWREHHARLPVRLLVYRGARFYLARQFTQYPPPAGHAPACGHQTVGGIVGTTRRAIVLLGHPGAF